MIVWIIIFCGIYRKAVLCVTETLLYELLVHLDVSIKVMVCHPLVVWLHWIVFGAICLGFSLQ
jgi:hypothetical protein